MVQPPRKKKDGMAIGSMVLGITSFTVLFWIGWIPAILGIILAVISLALHRDGKGFAVAGLVMSSLTVLIWIAIALGLGILISSI